jgi:hypothetical protein
MTTNTARPASQRMDWQAECAECPWTQVYRSHRAAVEGCRTHKAEHPGHWTKIEARDALGPREDGRAEMETAARELPRVVDSRQPEWAGRVSFLDGRRWISFTTHVTAGGPSAAASAAIRATRRKLLKGTRIAEVYVRLRRLPRLRDRAPSVRGARSGH